VRHVEIHEALITSPAAPELPLLHTRVAVRHSGQVGSVQELPISTDVTPSIEHVSEIVGALVAYNEQAAPGAAWSRIVCSARSSDGSLRGGVIGETMWSWLYVSHLWVDAESRGTGLGRRLLDHIGRAAGAHGCDRMHLDTFGFQAPTFYEHLGFRAFGALDDYPEGHRRQYFWRPITGW
jgi:GNAT superfamily N-acetyltransferase